MKYPTFDPTGINFDYEDYTEQKVLALKAALRNWGLILRRALRQEAKVDVRSELYHALSFRVMPQSKRDLNGKVRLLVGILDKDSPVLKYIKFYLYGNVTHFVPIYYHGKLTGILEWARKKNLITPGKNGKWVWVSGKWAGRTFDGVLAGNRGNDFFDRVYNKYNAEIKRDIQRIISEVE